jgi:hypothetical protein
MIEIGIDNVAPAGLREGAGAPPTVSCAALAYGYAHIVPAGRRLRAESPVINSTGQRPVGEMPSVKRSPERAESCKTNRMSPFQGYGRRSPLFTGRCPVVFGRKCSPCAVRHNMLVENTDCRPSPRPGWDGGKNCTGYFVFYQHIVPMAQRLHFLPNMTGQRPPLGVAERKLPAINEKIQT